MEIPAIDQETSDYDWFAIDSKGNIGHFASGGGILPHSVAASAEDFESLTDYFKLLKAEGNTYSLAPFFEFPKDIKTDAQREYFLSSYVRYSARGLYSFDRNQLDRKGKADAFGYGLITVPANPSSVNQLPITIQNILIKTRYNGIFSTSTVVSLLQFQGFLQ